MNGLLNSAAKEQAPEQGQKKGGSQAQYDMAAGQMIKWLASDEGYNATVQSLRSDPTQGMASLLGRLLTMVNQAAYMAGKSLSPNVLFQAGMEATKAVATIGMKEGILDKSNEAQIAEDAFFDGLAMFAQESQSEALSDESRQQFVQLIDAVEKMASKKGAA